MIDVCVAIGTMWLTLTGLFRALSAEPDQMSAMWIVLAAQTVLVSVCFAVSKMLKKRTRK